MILVLRNFILPIGLIGLTPFNTLAEQALKDLEKEMQQAYGEVEQEPALDPALAYQEKPPSTAKERARLVAKVKRLEARLKQLPKNLNLKQEIAVSYIKLKRYKDVIHLLKQDSDRLSKRGLMALSRAYDRSNNLKESIRVLSVYIGEKPPDHLLITLLGDAKRRAGDQTGAVLDFKSALSLKKNYEPAWKGLIKTFEDTQNSYELIIIYNDMIKHLGASDHSMNELCRLYASGGFLKKGKLFCQEAIQRSPKHPENHVFLGSILVDEGNTKQGYRIIKQAAKQFKKSELCQWKAGEVSEISSNYAGAARYYKQATRVDDKSSRAFLGLARAKFELQAYEEAYDAFFRACKLDKTKTQNFRTAGKRLRNEGKLKLARKYQAGLGRCLLKKRTPIIIEEPAEPLFEEL